MIYEKHDNKNENFEMFIFEKKNSNKKISK